MSIQKSILNAVLVTLIGCLFAGTASAALTYVDATEGGGGNTALAAGGTFTSVAVASGTDGLWRGRAFGNSSTIFESGGDNSSTGSALNGDNEDAPRLVTTISGLTPGSPYAIHALFWDTTASSQNWPIQASLSNPVGDLPVFDQDSAPLASTLTYVAEPLFVEGDRSLRVASLGTTVADGSGQVLVYVDDHPAPRQGITNGWQFRTWYDGVSYEIAVPEPTSLALALLGGLAIWFRRK